MLKVRADRRKNGRLRKYHYSKIQNAGDCVARTGVREIGFKFGSLPHDPGGITCMNTYNCAHLNGLISPIIEQGSEAQSVMCQVTDACLTADPGVVSSILAWSHTFMEIDHEIISTVILLPSTDALKKGCCQLQAKVCALITG